MARYVQKLRFMYISLRSVVHCPIWATLMQPANKTASRGCMNPILTTVSRQPHYDHRPF